MQMLSTVIQLRARNATPRLTYTGRQVQAWFLREVERKNATLAQWLHEEEKQPQSLRPYTLSAVYKGPFIAREVLPGEWCSLRITALNKELSEFLTMDLLGDLLPEARFGPAEFDVLPWHHQPSLDPRCCSISYSDLKKQAETSGENRLTLEFLSATSFKQLDQQVKTKQEQPGRIEIDLPLPAPDRVFGSYQKFWDAFSGEPIPNDFGLFIRECLAINELNIESERVQPDYNNHSRAVTGFSGKVRFAILGSPKKSRFGENWEKYASYARMLAHYSFYCGTGQDTTVGLGQTMLVTFQ